jgi:predicted Rossmann fold flavoprotein
MTSGNPSYDVIILGAGGAGLMCAATAGQRGRKVLLLDHADAAGKKILISGGGRCNFTNTRTSHKNYLSKNPHFAKSALARYKPADFIKLVDQYHIAWHEKTLGQLFCDVSAKQIVSMLLDECEKGKVDLKLSKEITSVSHSNELFTVKTDSGAYEAPSLVIATGGPSIPKMGATGFAYDLARQFKMKVVEPKPALVPFTLGKDEALFKELSGVATDTIASCGKTRFAEAALFTHKGLSGPAILQISSYWNHGDPVSINFMPELKQGWLSELKEARPNIKFETAIAQHLPDRLAEVLCDKLPVENQRDLGNCKNANLTTSEQMLANWKFHPNGTEGFAKAEVTIGGISTDELSSKTMESKKVKGLYCIGEAVDVTGWLGGYNFQWAWASGVVAGEVL